MGKFKAGLIGCGRIGYSFDLDSNRNGVWTHAKAFHEHPDIEFIGVNDNNSNIELECANHYDIQTMSYEEMVNQLDIISVAVPEEFHEYTLRKLLTEFDLAHKTPKILWVEKPFTGDHATARFFVDEFAKYNCHIHINYQRRYCDGFEFLKSQPSPCHVDVIYVRGLLNTATHFIDFILGLFGTELCVGHPVKVIKVSDTNFVLDYHLFKINFSMLSATQYNICDTIFYYEDKIIKVPPLQTFLSIKNLVKSSQYSEYMDLGPEEIVSFNYNPMINQLSILVEAIRSSKYHKLNNGLGVLEIIERLK